MGIFDFLGDLSSKRGKELDLGGLKSLLGTRKAAEAGARGDEMMKITGGDSLPGYFNPETREYVPWYVDLFDGGGLNSAGGVAAKMPASETGLLGSGPSPRRADVQAQAAPDFQYDYPTEFRPSPEPSSMQSLEQPFGSRIVPVSTAGPSSQPDSNIMLGDLYKGTGRDMPTMPGMDVPLAPQSFSGGAIDAPAAGFPTADENSLWNRALSGELAESNRAALNGNASTSNSSLPQSQSVDPTEFERFKSKFEKELKANGLWGFPNKIQEALDSLKARGFNY